MAPARKAAKKAAKAKKAEKTAGKTTGKAGKKVTKAAKRTTRKAAGKATKRTARPPKRLEAYREKRDFERTPEPSGAVPPAMGPEPIFVVQKHDARNLHYDLRLEVAGVLASWAVPKGPSLDPAQRRLAVRTEDHPLEYAGFEGTIPEGEYGGGTVMVWDRGTYANLRQEKEGDGATMGEALADGVVEVRLAGRKLRGAWSLVRTKGFGGRPGAESWLLIKKRDGDAEPGSDVTAAQPDSVLSGRSLERIAEEEGGA